MIAVATAITANATIVSVKIDFLRINMKKHQFKLDSNILLAHKLILFNSKIQFF